MYKRIEATIEGTKYIDRDIAHNIINEFLNDQISLADVRTMDLIPKATLEPSERDEENLVQWILHLIMSRQLFSESSFHCSVLYCRECDALLWVSMHEAISPCEDHDHIFIDIKAYD